jgi:hypothetical protein
VQPLELSFRDCPGSDRSEVQVVRIGPQIGHRTEAMDAVWFIGLPGEPFTHYSTELGRHFHRRLGVHPDRVLVCGYTNDVVGYFCTPRALREGGYEAAVAHEMYHRPSAFSADTQAIVFDHVLKAATGLIGPKPLRMTSQASFRLKRFGQRLLSTALSFMHLRHTHPKGTS